MNRTANELRVRYAQCWEDPLTVSRALDVGPDDDVISIASGGDNSFALLLNNPRSLTMVDSNGAQIALVELKIQAIRHLDYDDFVAFIGARPCGTRKHIYVRLRSFLSENGGEFWDERIEDVERGIIHCGKFEQYLALLRRHVLPLIHRKQTIEQLLSASTLEEQRNFYRQVWDNRRWRWLFHVFFGRFLLGRLGRDPALFRYVTLHDVGRQLLARAARGLSEIPIRDNFFLFYMLTGRYPNLETASPYLSKGNFQILKDTVKRLRLFHGTLDDYLAVTPPGSASKFNLSDIFEYLSESGVERMLQSILRVCRDGARLAFWTLFVNRTIPPAVSGCIQSSVPDAVRLAGRDRGFFYDRFTVWSIAKAAAS